MNRIARQRFTLEPLLSATRKSMQQASTTSPAGTQSLGMQQCPSCGARNHASASICLECGEKLRQRPKKIRCRQCGHQASSSLTICPNCGRELHAAPSRFWTWVVPLIFVLVLALFFVSRVGGPISWARERAGSAIAWVSGMGEEMDPHMTIIMTPESDTPVLELVGPGVVMDGEDTDTVDSSLVDSSTDDSRSVESNMSESNADDANADGEAIVAILPTNTSTSLPTDTPSPAPTATSSETPAPTATKGATPTPSATPTKQSTPSATTKAVTNRSATSVATARTATPRADRKTGDETDADTTVESELVILQPTKTPESASGSLSASELALVPTAQPSEARSYTVLAGDTLLSIAERFSTSVELLMMANDIAPDEAYTLKVGETLTIVSDDDAPLTQSYTVRAGDTFVTIANRFDISTRALQVVNGFSDAQVRLLRPGQTLIIPTDDDGPTSIVALAPTTAPATPTQRPTASPTPAPTAVPTATPSPLRLDAPILRSPENNTVVSCQGNGQMAWSAVNFVTDTDEYVMHLGFVSNQDVNGNDTITWVLNQQRPSNRTSWEMDPGLCGLAPQEYGRQWRWYVEIVDEDGVTVSPPSETWGFSWN
jgi:LysM repeat protein